MMQPPPYLRPEITEAVSSAYAEGRYDDAIFGAFKAVEGAVQVHVDSADIGRGLIEKAFGVGGIDISDDPRDSRSATDLFSGAIGLYRGDRAHGLTPALPIRDRLKADRILGVASALLDLLDADRNTLPVIASDHVAADLVTLVCKNLQSSTECCLDGKPMPVVQNDGTLMTLQVSGIEAGPYTLNLRNDDRVGPDYILHVPQPASPIPGEDNWYRVIASDVEVGADPNFQQLHEHTAVVLEANEGGHRSLRCFPTDRSYQAGQYVTWAFDSETVSRSRGWVRAPGADVPSSAWSVSAMFCGEVIAGPGDPQLAGIRIQPEGLGSLSPGSTLLLLVEATYVDGPARWAELLDPNDCTFETTDPKIAHVTQAGTLRTKRFGEATITVRFGRKHASTSIQVVSRPYRATTPIGGGFGLLTGATKHPEQGVLLTNRTNKVLQLSAERLVTVAQVQLGGFNSMGLDTICVGGGDIYARTVDQPSRIIVFEGPDYWSYREFVLPGEATPMFLAGTSDGALVTAGPNLWRLRGGKDEPALVAKLIDGNKMETLTVLTVEDGSAYILDNIGQLHIVELQDGSHSIRKVGEGNEYSGIARHRGETYLVRFHAGTFVRLDPDGETVLASGLGNPTSLYAEPTGTFVVGDFSGGSLYRIGGPEH